MLFHRSFGDPKKPLLICLHGFLGSHKDFVPVIEKWQEDYYCVAFDLPGHGRSPYAPNILPALKKEILSFAKEPILIGYSMGGRLALRLAKEIPVKALIAISSHLGLKSHAEKEKRKGADFAWKEKLLTLSSDEFLSLWYNQGVFSTLRKNEKLLSSLLKKRRYQNKEELALVLDEMSLANQPFYDTFSSPTLFVCGEEDKKYKSLYKNLPSSIIEGASHALLEESPDKLAEEIHNFLQKETLCKLP